MKTLTETISIIMIGIIISMVLIYAFEKDNYNFNRNAAHARAERIIDGYKLLINDCYTKSYKGKRDHEELSRLIEIIRAAGVEVVK